MFLNKHYKNLEKNLIEKYSSQNENEAVLEDEDFKDGRLTISGYERLKQQCDYIPYSEQIEIKIPKKHEDGFKERLESLGASELLKMRQDRKGARINSLILLVLGIVSFAIGSIVEFFFSNTHIVFYIAIIVSWVFIWAATEKWFFDRRDLHEKRKSLIQILSSNITSTEKEDN
ncbi:MAG: hypothetical protein FWC11_00980 [Firmicutes bacterium]|nr:hypothetical protein [Bacillota bacterium]